MEEILFFSFVNVGVSHGENLSPVMFDIYLHAFRMFITWSSHLKYTAFWSTSYTSFALW